MIFTPSPCHKLSHFLRPPPPLERDILYGRPLLEKLLYIVSYVRAPLRCSSIIGYCRLF